MMLDILNLAATTILAIAAVAIARNANLIARHSNELSGNANEISKQAIKLEADKHLIEWGQRVLCCSSSLVSLRTLKKGEISEAEFIGKRRDLRATLFALKEEGQLFFRFSGRFDETGCPPALKAVHDLTELTHGKTFKLPAETYDGEGVKELRDKVRILINDVQARVSDHWMR